MDAVPRPCTAPPYVGILEVLCSQPEDDVAPIRGLVSGDFRFNILAFNPNVQFGELQQTYGNTEGTDVAPRNFITSGKAFVMPRAGGPVHEVMITQPTHFSSGMLCNQQGPAVVVQAEPNAPKMLFGLQEVDCSSCPCVPSTQNPTDLKLTVPLRTTDGSLVMRDVFVPLPLTLSVDSTALGSISLGELGSCAGAAAPTASEIGLVLLTLALLATGAWALGRRRAFSESIPLP